MERASRETTGRMVTWIDTSCSLKLELGERSTGQPDGLWEWIIIHNGCLCQGWWKEMAMKTAISATLGHLKMNLEWLDRPRAELIHRPLVQQLVSVPHFSQKRECLQITPVLPRQKVGFNLNINPVAPLPLWLQCIYISTKLCLHMFLVCYLLWSLTIARHLIHSGCIKITVRYSNLHLARTLAEMSALSFSPHFLPFKPLPGIHLHFCLSIPASSSWMSWTSLGKEPGYASKSKTYHCHMTWQVPSWVYIQRNEKDACSPMVISVLQKPEDRNNPQFRRLADKPSIPSPSRNSDISQPQCSSHFTPKRAPD